MNELTEETINKRVIIFKIKLIHKCVSTEELKTNFGLEQSVGIPRKVIKKSHKQMAVTFCLPHTELNVHYMDKLD